MSDKRPVHDNVDYAIRLIEEERRRIARELHDGPAQSLTNISMRLEILQRVFQSNPAMVAGEIKKISSRVFEAVNDMRRLIYDLRPVSIDENGLLNATLNLCGRYEREWNIPITVTPMEDPRVFSILSRAKKVAVYRLILEALHNVHKHAQAKSIEVTFSFRENQMRIEIHDDGIGFNPDDSFPEHYGLIGMQERAAFLGASLEIQSQDNLGSTFILTIPCELDGTYMHETDTNEDA